MTDAQLDFIPKVREFNKTGEEPIVMYNLDDLPPNEELLRGEIDKDTYRSIKANGQLYPILLANTTDGNVAIIDGEQRVKIQRQLHNDAQIPAIFHSEELDTFDIALLRTHMNNARQENPIADIEGIRHVRSNFPNMSAKGIAAMTGIKLGRVKSLMKQANMPQMFIDAVSDGTMSKDTLADLSKKPLSIQRKAENKYRNEREKIQVIDDEASGKKVFKRLSDDHVFASPPSLLTANDVKDFQRISVETKIDSLPLNLNIERAVEGFAAVKDGKFITDMLDSADEVRLELGRKKGIVVKVRGI